MRRYRQSPTLSRLGGRSKLCCCSAPHCGILHPGIINVNGTRPCMYEVRRVLLPHSGLSEPLASALVLPAVSVLSPKAPKQEAWGMKMIWGDGSRVYLIFIYRSYRASSKKYLLCLVTGQASPHVYLFFLTIFSPPLQPKKRLNKSLCRSSPFAALALFFLFNSSFSGSDLKKGHHRRIVTASLLRFFLPFRCPSSSCVQH
jgi:hypothetical protein